MTDEQNTEQDEVEGQGLRHGDKSEVAGQGVRHGMTEDADASEDKATESQDEKTDEPEVEGQRRHFRGSEK